MRSIKGNDDRGRWLSAISVALLLVIVTGRYLVLSWPIPAILDDHIVIPEGASAYQVARALHERGYIPNEKLFVNALRLKFKARSLKPGLFRLVNVRMIGDLVDQLIDPQRNAVWVTIPEGKTRREVARFFGAKYPIDTARFLALTEDKIFISKLGLDAKDLEGYLFPETYYLPNGTTEREIITRMVAQTREALSVAVIRRGAELGFDEGAILTMASIVEGETRIDSERTIVSAVYHNRLKKGMRLQADPTVQFSLPEGPRRLLYRDYDVRSEYNTYLHGGLPPGPVNNPGRASIEAAVSPADVDYLYFVASGDGGHIFTRSLGEHNGTIDRLRQGD
ncbi:MAG: endolytic transglycosylase MltG [Candidatus Marinimicrobia bacterium]|nr:endolytic transglycosylase MltG [Candidatus Neomarinimicrobiota bacterium]